MTLSPSPQTSPSNPDWGVVLPSPLGHGYLLSHHKSEAEARSVVKAFWLLRHGETPEQFLDACAADFRGENPDAYPEGVSGVDALGLDFFYETLASGHGIRIGRWTAPQHIEFVTGGSMTFRHSLD